MREKLLTVLFSYGLNLKDLGIHVFDSSKTYKDLHKRFDEYDDDFINSFQDSIEKLLKSLSSDEKEFVKKSFAAGERHEYSESELRLVLDKLFIYPVWHRKGKGFLGVTQKAIEHFIKTGEVVAKDDTATNDLTLETIQITSYYMAKDVM